MDNNVTENIDEFFGKISEAADIVTEKLVEVTPEAADALLSLVQAKGIFDLATATPVILCLIWASIILMKKSIKFYQADENPMFVPAGASALMLGFVAFAVSCETILNFYIWASVFYPEGAVAMRALEAAGITL